MLRICAIILLAFLFSSCTNKFKSDLAVFKATDEGFLYSNGVISNSTTIIYRALDEKLLQPETARQAAEWQPKAMFIKEKSAETFKYLDSLITELKKEADLRLIMESMKEAYNEDDVDVASRLFIDKKIGDELFEKLQKYKNDILAADQELNQKFGNNLIIITRDFELSGAKPKDFATTFFDNVPAIAAVAMLRKLENNVRVLENKFVTFCFNKIGSLDGPGSFTRVGVLVSQSSSYLKAGESIEIYAGVGEFSTAAKPKIIIMGKNVDSKGKAFASYKFKTPLKAGKYTVPVKIEYTKEDGTKAVDVVNLDYTVIE